MWRENGVYYKYSDYLKNKYGAKVYKIPINLDIGCPNGKTGGCTFCAKGGVGLYDLDHSLSVRQQVSLRKEHLQKKYKPEKYIAYFQNFTNTYMPLPKFKQYMNEAAGCGDIVEIAVSTRPDCIRADYLDVLLDLKHTYHVDISIELGLQTANYRTLLKINRGHTLGEFIDATLLIKQFGFDICAHIILNLPWDDVTDCIETAKIVSALKIDQVKLHALYIAKGSVMEKQFALKEFALLPLEEYKKRVIIFLEHLSPDIAVQRLVGRASKTFAPLANWNMSWWKIRDEIEREMAENGSYQGKCFDYLNGKALKNL